MLNMLGVCYKKDWENVAQQMGYETTAPLKKAIDSLVEKGIVTVDKYSVSFKPLFDKCLHDEWPDYIAVEIEQKAEPVKKENKFYTLWGDMCKVALLAPNENKWAKHTLSKLNFAREDILGYAQYIESWHQFKDRNNEVRTKMLYPNADQLKINIQKWIDGGRKERYITQMENIEL
jgi:hypothetical protein